jgi:C-terminal processing protease CtpA/Prc
MVSRIAAGAALAIVCVLLTAASAVAGEKTHTITICTPETEGEEIKVSVEVEELAWLCVSIQDLTDKIRAKLGLADDVDGVLVTDVHEDSPAEKAGLADGDVIIAVGGQEAHSVSKLGDLIGSKAPGTEAEIVVLRDGKQKKVVAILGSSPVMVSTSGHGGLLEGLLGLKSLEGITIPGIPWIDIGISKASGRGRLGVYPDDLSEGLAEYFGVPGGKGALVEDIVDDSPAEKAGIKPGDVIVKIGDDKVSDVGSLVEAIGNMEADVETPIVVFRKGKELSLKATVGESEYEKAMKEYSKAIKIRADELGSKTIYVRENEAEALEEEVEKLREELEELREELKELRD